MIDITATSQAMYRKGEIELIAKFKMWFGKEHLNTILAENTIVSFYQDFVTVWVTVKKA